MAKLAALALSVCLFAAALPAAEAQQSPPPGPGAGPAGPGMISANVATSRVTVADIDRARRTATLRADDGSEFVVDVPDTVRNFDELQEGDVVTIRYEVATAIFLKKPGEPMESAGSSAGGPSVVQSETVMTAPRGEKPGGTVTKVTELTATVEKVDYANRKVTLRGPQGRTETVDVGDDVAHLDRVKAGDQVQVRHTEAVALSVTK